jgi:hypothetical protein
LSFSFLRALPPSSPAHALRADVPFSLQGERDALRFFFRFSVLSSNHQLHFMIKSEAERGFFVISAERIFAAAQIKRPVASRKKILYSI